MVAILIDKTYSDSLWCQIMFLSLTERLRSKRIPFCEIFDSCPAQCDTVFIIATDHEWTSGVVHQLNASGRSPILLCNQYENLPGCVYSCVCSDVNAAMKYLLESLRAKGRERIAVYGMNPTSISDISRVNSLFAWRDPAEEPMAVFLNEASLEQCFASFYPQIQQFDAVICTNDYAAISLVRKLLTREPGRLENLSIISCSESNLCSYYRNYISTVNVNFDQFGRAAVYIYESLRKRPYLSGMTLNVAWGYREEDEPDPTFPEIPLTLSRTADDFYQDPELQEMLIVDKLLNATDTVDKEILAGLAKGKTNEELAETCFLSEGSIKYRIKRLQGVSGATGREDIIRLLTKYVTEVS